jgi:hypothetical protein
VREEVERDEAAAVRVLLELVGHDARRRRLQVQLLCERLDLLVPIVAKELLVRIRVRFRVRVRVRVRVRFGVMVRVRVRVRVRLGLGTGLRLGLGAPSLRACQ